MSKERLTLFLCGNMCGNMEKAVVIGKAKRLHCFKRLDILSLPVYWQHKKRAWMTTVLMEQWLTGFNNRMKKENRKVILFLDNATCATYGSGSDLYIQSPLPTPFAPASYSEDFFFFFFFSSCKSVNELANVISVLDAVHWISASIKEIQPETMTKCFKKAGFQDSFTL